MGRCEWIGPNRTGRSSIQFSWIFGYRQRRQDLFSIRRGSTIERVFSPVQTRQISTFIPADAVLRFPYVTEALSDNRKLVMASRTNLGRGIFDGPNPQANLVLQIDPVGTTPFGAIEHFRMNEAGDCLFQTTVNGMDTLMVGTNPATDVYLDTSGPFSTIDPIGVAINARGTTAFLATLDDGRKGILVRSILATDAVIMMGDSLYGSTVTDILYYGGLEQFRPDGLRLQTRKWSQWCCYCCGSRTHDDHRPRTSTIDAATEAVQFVRRFAVS